MTSSFAGVFEPGAASGPISVLVSPQYLGMTLSRARFRVVRLLTFHPYVAHAPEARYRIHTRTLTCSVTVAGKLTPNR